MIDIWLPAANLNNREREGILLKTLTSPLQKKMPATTTLLECAAFVDKAQNYEHCTIV